MTGEADGHLAWICLGSNIDPERHLPAAVMAVQSLGTLVRVSSVWESAPVGDENQARFCNAALLLWTTLAPAELKAGLRGIETRLGRVRDPLNKNAARTIDLDLGFFDELTGVEESLTIPDPEIVNRPFLAVPLAELTPEYVHPECGRTLTEIAQDLGGTASLRLRADLVLCAAD